MGKTFDPSQFEFSKDYHCFPSQRIREWVEKGLINGVRSIEEQIQPASMDTTAGEEGFVISDDVTLDPRGGQVYTALLEIPQSKRRKIDLSEPFELRQGQRTLIPVETKFKMVDEEGRIALKSVESSQKSTFGRLFFRTKAYFDYANRPDQILLEEAQDREIMTWLLTKPSAFDTIVPPGQAINQLRFFHGQNSCLTNQELREDEKAILYLMNASGEFIPRQIIERNGIRIHLDLEGNNTSGIVGFRAKKGRKAIDLTKGRQSHDVENYFDPIRVKDHEIKLKFNENYLFASEEFMSIPIDRAVELREPAISFLGSTHQAGFADPFFGMPHPRKLVYEITSNETEEVSLHHGKVIGIVEVSRLEEADIKYGNNYARQQGPDPAKYLTCDYDRIAGNYQSLEKEVLVCDIKSMLSRNIRETATGFEFLNPAKREDLIDALENGFWSKRRECESDELVIQPIPYVILFSEGKVFCYRRAQDHKKTGETELFGKDSIGIGGHIQKQDSPDYARKCVQRNLSEEVEVRAMFPDLRPVGTLYETDKPVDQRHFGIVFVANGRGEITRRSQSIADSRMMSLDDIMQSDQTNFETWSKSLIPSLPELYQMASR